MTFLGMPGIRITTNHTAARPISFHQMPIILVDNEPWGLHLQSLRIEPSAKMLNRVGQNLHQTVFKTQASLLLDEH